MGEIRLFWSGWEQNGEQIGTVELPFEFAYVFSTYKGKYAPFPKFDIGSYVTGMMHASWPAKIALFFAYFSGVKGGYTPPITHVLLLHLQSNIHGLKYWWLNIRRARYSWGRYLTESSLQYETYLGSRFDHSSSRDYSALQVVSGTCATGRF